MLYTVKNVHIINVMELEDRTGSYRPSLRLGDVGKVTPPNSIMFREEADNRFFFVTAKKALRLDTGGPSCCRRIPLPAGEICPISVRPPGLPGDNRAAIKLKAARAPFRFAGL